jgi:hypothetical protein
MRKSFYGFLYFLILGLAASCTSYQAGRESTIPSVRKFSAFSYIKENRDLAVIVDTELARRRKGEDYFPLGIKIANKSIEGLIVDRESLLLVDQEGKVYSMPDILELQKYYDLLAPDHKFKSQTGLIGDQMLTSFSYFRKAVSNFFPETQGAAKVVDRVYIQKNGYMEDLIYFPMPPGGIEGKILILRLDALQLDAPFEIGFPVD